MRFWATFETPEPVHLPTNYNYAVQGFIYRSLSDEFRKFLHDEGFTAGGRSFKLFTFSRLFGRFKREGKVLVFRGPIRLCISSPIERFVRQLANSLLKNANITLIGNELSVSSIEFPNSPIIGSELSCRTLAPITVYSTMFTADGHKKTYYYSPYEEEFSNSIAANLRKKASLITGEVADGDVAVKPIGRPREVACIFKDTVVRAWHGRFKLTGDKRLLEAGYEAGLGSKNSGGFGMIEVVK
ncbi:MAG: CRISPR-associated endoribonuclease Cas6 [Nitrososphaerota archaeon]